MARLAPIPREDWDHQAKAVTIGEGNDALVLWKCPKCSGFYQTEQQASVISHGGSDGPGHKCRSRPSPADWAKFPIRLP